MQYEEALVYLSSKAEKAVIAEYREKGIPPLMQVLVEPTAERIESPGARREELAKHHLTVHITSFALISRDGRACVLHYGGFRGIECKAPKGFRWIKDTKFGALKLRCWNGIEHVLTADDLLDGKHNTFTTRCEINLKSE